MDVLNPSTGPPNDANYLYPTLPLDKRLDFLTGLLESEKIADYTKLLSKDSEMENSDAFKAALKPFAFSIKNFNWP
jgi:hypothetical protein